MRLLDYEHAFLRVQKRRRSLKHEAAYDRPSSHIARSLLLNAGLRVANCRRRRRHVPLPSELRCRSEHFNNSNIAFSN